MAKRVLFLLLALFCLATVAASAIDLAKFKTEDLRLEKGQNTSLILYPAAPFSIRLYEGAVVEFDIDGSTHKAIFDKIGDVSVIRYTLDGGRTFTQLNMPLGNSTMVRLNSSSLFFFINYKILHDSQNASDKNAIFEIGIPYIQRYDMPVNMVNNTEFNNTIKEEMNKTIEEVVPQQDKKESSNYVKYLVGIIIVLILVIIVLGPRKKEIEIHIGKAKESMKNAVGMAKKGKEKKGESVNRNYYKKPKKKSFNEEDVYVVKESEEE